MLFYDFKWFIFAIKKKTCHCAVFPCAPDSVLPKFNIDLVVALLRQENAKDICVIQLSPEVNYCDYFIIVSGFSTRHLHAMANYMLKMVRQFLLLSLSFGNGFKCWERNFPRIACVGVYKIR